MAASYGNEPLIMFIRLSHEAIVFPSTHFALRNASK